MAIGQPRDRLGRWTSGVGGALGAATVLTSTGYARVGAVRGAAAAGGGFKRGFSAGRAGAGQVTVGKLLTGQTSINPVGQFRQARSAAYRASKASQLVTAFGAGKPLQRSVGKAAARQVRSSGLLSPKLKIQPLGNRKK